MTSDFESAFRQILKSVVREVFEEVVQEHNFQTAINRPYRQSDQIDERLLLRAREAAKRLAISERHLFKLTSKGEIPCVRIGRLVHYSVETIEKWIRKTESIGVPSKRTGQDEKRKTTSKAVSTTPKAKTKRRRAASNAKQLTPCDNDKTGTKKSRKHPVKKVENAKEPERINPFTELLKEMGIGRDDVGPMSNGELMRIAEVELPVYHGWMYLGREMPEVALEKLRKHFRER